jgi:hypothetical protein
MSDSKRGKTRGRGNGKARVKRQHVQSEDGWTIITHGLSKVALDPSKAKKEVAGVLPGKTVEDLTPSKLVSEFERLKDRWNENIVAAQISDLVGRKIWDVDTAVCIGIGSFSRDWEHRWRSLWQLVLFMDIIRHLKNSNKELKVCAQDPAFTSLDNSFLSTLNVTTTASGIESHITPKSFVFSPFVDWYILLPTFLASKDPVLYVGNEILDDYTPYAQGDKKEKLETCNALGREFLDKRERVKIKEFDGGRGLEGMRVYWKKTTREGDGGDSEAKPV